MVLSKVWQNFSKEGLKTQKGLIPRKIPTRKRKPSPKRKGYIPRIIFLKKIVPQEQKVAKGFASIIVHKGRVPMSVP